MVHSGSNAQLCQGHHSNVPGAQLASRRGVKGRRLWPTWAGQDGNSLISAASNTKKVAPMIRGISAPEHDGRGLTLPTTGVLPHFINKYSTVQRGCVTCLSHRAGKWQSQDGTLGRLCGSAGPMKHRSAVKILQHSKDLGGHHCYFTEPTRGKGYPEKPLFPSLPHGWLLASAAQTMRILTVWWNQPKKAGD